MRDWKPEIRRRLASVKLESTREAAIVDELCQHLDDCYAELLAAGATEAEASQQTLAELHGSELLAAELRRAQRQVPQEPILLGTNRRINMIADLWQDLRYGTRALWNNRAFTLVAVLSLSLGIGATTTVFSLVNAVLLRPLPVKHADTLVSVHKIEPDGSRIHAISYPDYQDYRTRNDVFDDLLVWSESGLSVNLDGQAEQAYGMLVSGNYFSMLGVVKAGRAASSQKDSEVNCHTLTARVS